MTRTNLLAPARRALLAFKVTVAALTARDETTTVVATPSQLAIVNGNNQTLGLHCGFRISACETAAVGHCADG